MAVQEVNLLIHSATQLITCAADGPKRGANLCDIGMIPDGALAVTNGEIVAVGASSVLRSTYSASQEIDASGMVVCPGFVDPHTHAVYAGDRVNEFEMRVGGASYLDIMAAGGGILSTMRATRGANLDALVAQTRRRLDVLLALGTTTVEIKTGYGLEPNHELKLLQAIELLASSHPIEIIPTFLGAHAIPPEYAERSDDYVELVVQEMIPRVADWHRNSWFAQQRPDDALFIDVFCERHAFSAAQTQRILAAGFAAGMRPKAHVDQFTSLGGVAIAIQLGAISVDHLEVTNADDIALLAQSDTIGVVIPAANVNLGVPHHAPARDLVDAGVALALCTDLNPGSAPCYSLPLVMGLACRYMKLLPAEAFNAATINAAYAIGCGDRLGSLEIGKQADILVLDVPDYRHVAYYLGGNPVQQVVKNGRVI